jgi:hypothetical protein
MGRAADRSAAAVWERRVAVQRRSKLTVAEFCRQEGARPPTRPRTPPLAPSGMVRPDGYGTGEV